MIIGIRSSPHSYCVFEAGGCSDHLRCRIHLGNEIYHWKKKPFKFVNAVLELEQFQPMVEQKWRESQPIFLSTFSLFRFSKNLKDLKPLIRNLAKEWMGSLSMKTTEALSTLYVKQEVSLTNPSLLNLEAEVDAYRRWNHISGLEENFLKQKSRLHWLRIGDRNNKIFHKEAAVKKSRNTIREIKQNDGTTARAIAEIKEEAVCFF